MSQEIVIPAAAPSVPPVAHHSVLVVEDDRDFRDVIAIQLRRHGFDVLESDNAGSAWELARDLAPAAIVMDIRLPGIDGESLARQLRHKLERRIVLIAFTASPHDSVEAGPFDAVVEKPDVSAVASHLSRLLR